MSAPEVVVIAQRCFASKIMSSTDFMLAGSPAAS